MSVSLSLVGAMDRLWFHHAIIFNDPISLPSPKSPQPSSDYDKSSPSTEEEEITLKVRRRWRCKSHSPEHQRQQHSKTPSSKRLEKSISSKTYEDLEQEEVKGFIDLGFRFKKEHISPRMMTVIPGLQKVIKTKSTMDQCRDKNETMRPYLSEAWLVKRPDSPLLNMKVRRGYYAAADMKKQLKSWARTVATETIQSHACPGT